MSAKIHDRRRAREAALAILYSSDITERDAMSIVEDGDYPADDVDVREYAEMLLDGVAERREEIDAMLSSTSENWALDRMPIVDRALLRLAVYEMLYVDNVPVSVSINEAVELAKAYGGEDESSRFVNGVLGRIARSLEERSARQGADGGVEASAAENVASDAGEQDETTGENAGESVGESGQ